jgi:hypothetical protein
MEKEKQDLIDKIIELTVESLRLTAPCMSVRELQKLYIEVSAGLATAKAANELIKKIEEKKEEE